MKKQYGFYVDLDRCLKCCGCQVACKMEHNLPPLPGSPAGTQGLKWRRVVEILSGSYPDFKKLFVSLSCMHCAKPACAAVCPTGAISKRVEDGIVVVDSNKCIGCHYCFFACPFGAPQYGDDGLMQKCNYCLERLEKGLEPACSNTCPAQALHTGTMEELAQLAAKKAGTRLAASTQPSILISK
ncbi:MAG: 4Fe-4S dicluster domain-containing protein [Chloroflexi bacterium]|nr:4Fe-4S dicluster domain-containing protein [Chloroflexota bacterium]